MANEKRLIDANVLLEKLRKNRKPGYGYATATVGEMPTIDAVEVVHGRWKHHYEKGTSYKVCSICGCRNGLELKFNYCPNCGAKMDGDGNG